MTLTADGRDQAVDDSGSARYLKTGAEYIEALRDDREVWYAGERVEDVTTHPALGPGIRWNAELYDAQHDPESRDQITFLRDGDRVSTSWILPKTPEDLVKARECCEFFAWHGAAWMGRQPDMISWSQRGLNAVRPTFERHSPDLAGNLDTYLRFAQDNNVHMAAVIVEAQGDGSRAARAGNERENVLQIVKRDDNGIWINGARAVGSVSPQCNELMVGNINRAQELRPEESFWCTIPVATPGVKMICRETVAHHDSNQFDHPIASKGDEMDAFVVFSNAFVPYERVFSMGVPDLHEADFFTEMSRGEHWHVLNRFTIRAEFIVGLAQLVVDALGTGGIPVVRDQVARLLEFAQILRAGVIAAEHKASYTEGGVLMPDGDVINAVRSYGLGQLPQVTHILQELCGQGLAMRFTSSTFDREELGRDIERYMGNRNISAREKSRIMNAVWDYTLSSHGGRSALFENVNALAGFTLRGRLYGGVDRSEVVDRVADFIGLQERP